MPAWWYMFAYTIFMAIIGTLFYKNRQYITEESTLSNNNKNYRDSSISLFFALLTFALIVFYAGERSWVYDTYDYMSSYNNFDASNLSYISDVIKGDIEVKGPGFSILLCLFKHFTGGDYNSWFFFIAIIEGVCLSYFLYRYSTNFALSVYMIFTSGVFVWMFNGFRQFLAVCIILLFSDFLFNRKTIPFLFVVLLAYSIHSSAILFIPVYFIVNFNPWSKKIVVLSILFFIGIYILTQTSILGEDFEYSYLSTDVAGTTGVSPIRVLFMSIPTVLAFISKEKIGSINNKIIEYCVNISFICTGCYVVSMFTNGVMGRVPIYFQMFNYLLYPWLLYNAFDKKTSKLFLYTFVFVFFLYFLYDAYINKNYFYQSQNLDLYYKIEF